MTNERNPADYIAPYDEFGNPLPSEEQRLQAIAAANARVRELKEGYKASYLEAELRVARNIRDQRLAAGLSQERLAGGLRVLGFDFTQSTIAKIEAGTRPLRIAELLAFADALDVPWTAIMEGGRLIDILPIGDMLPMDELEVRVEEMIAHRDDVMAELSDTVATAAKRYAQLDAEIILLAAALSRAAAAADRAEADGSLDRELAERMAEKWLEDAAEGSAQARRWRERQREIRKLVQGAKASDSA